MLFQCSPQRFNKGLRRKLIYIRRVGVCLNCRSWVSGERPRKSFCQGTAQLRWCVDVDNIVHLHSSVLSFTVKCSCHAEVAWSKPHSKISIAPATSSYRQGRQLSKPAPLVGPQKQLRPMGRPLSFGGTCSYLRLAGLAFGLFAVQTRVRPHLHFRSESQTSIHNGQGSLQSW